MVSLTHRKLVDLAAKKKGWRSWGDAGILVAIRLSENGQGSRNPQSGFSQRRQESVFQHLGLSGVEYQPSWPDSRLHLDGQPGGQATDWAPNYIPKYVKQRGLPDGNACFQLIWCAII